MSEEKQTVKELNLDRENIDEKANEEEKIEESIIDYSNREIIEETLPVSNQKVKFLSWITGKEKRKVSNMYYEKFAKNKELNSEEIEKTVTPEELAKIQDNLVVLACIELNGSDKDIDKRYLDLPSKDSDYILAKVQSITSILEEEEKKN